MVAVHKHVCGWRGAHGPAARAEGTTATTATTAAPSRSARHLLRHGFREPSAGRQGRAYAAGGFGARSRRETAGPTCSRPERTRGGGGGSGGTSCGASAAQKSTSVRVVREPGPAVSARLDKQLYRHVCSRPPWRSEHGRTQDALADSGETPPRPTHGCHRPGGGCVHVATCREPVCRCSKGGRARGDPRPRTWPCAAAPGHS